MPSVGPGVREIRVHSNLEHRVIYVARFEEGVYVLHAFEKKSRKTPKADVELARARLSTFVRTREQGSPPGERKVVMKVKVQRSTGNVFRDVGFHAEQAESLRLRAALMVEIKRLMQARRLTQTAAARLFGVTQPRMSDLVRGKIELFSLDTLVDMLARVGMRVQLRVGRKRRRPHHADAA